MQFLCTALTVYIHNTHILISTSLQCTLSTCVYLINTASNFVFYKSTLAKPKQIAWSHLKVYSRLHMCRWSVMCATLLPFLQHVPVTPLVLLLASLATPSVGSAPARQESQGSVATGATMGSTTSHRMAAEVN